MAASGTTQAAATGLSRRTKPEAENWDEDFDFVLPKRPARPAASSPSQPHELASEPSVPGAGAKPRPRRISSPIEDWDEELPEAGPSSRPLGEPMSASPEAKHREAYQPTSSVLESLSGLRLASPSGSQSHHGDHVMPTTNGSGGSRADKTPSTITVAWSRRELTDDPWSGEAAVPQSKTCHTSGTPSTEVSTSLPASTYPPDALLASPAKTIHHSKSREQMPPPSAPVSASASQRMSSRSSSRATLNEEATLAADGSADPDKKPGFWKRLSGNPGGPSMPSGSRTASHHRRRSSAFLPSRSPAPDLPPVPPVPSSMRSVSGTSAVSAGSALSQGSSTASTPTGRDPNRSGLASLSGMLRRSSSRLSRVPRGSPAPPIPSSPSAAALSQGGPSAWSRSSSASARGPATAFPSVNGTITDPSPRLASSASFSRGFHLPSPSPQSPYNHSDTGIAPQPKLRSLRRSPSFPSRPTMGSEGLGRDLSEDSRERRRVRPVSALPSARQQEPITSGRPAHASLAEVPPSAYLPVPLPPTSEKTANLDANGLPRSPSMAKSSTFRRLASASRKHGRRISGGWRFGSAPSSPSGDSRRISAAAQANGSPGPEQRKGGAAAGAMTEARAEPTLNGQSDTRSSGAMDGFSREKTGSQTEHTFSTATEGQASRTAASPPDRASIDPPKSTARRRRRSSWGDFVIPREVLDKQKGVKRGIGAVKQFAAGVESLKSLERLHVTAQRRLSARPGRRNAELASLEADYAQYWEMASVLIELASTGQDVQAGQTGDADRTDPAAGTSGESSQSRRNADPSAKPHGTNGRAPTGQTARVLSSSSADWDADFDFAASAAPKAIGLRTSSLPEPDRSTAGVLDSSQGPPRADLELWHASTGRHDLSKRQLEVLRTMLSSPAPIGKDELLRSDHSRPSEPTRRETAPEVSKVFAQSAPNTPNPGEGRYTTLQAARDPRLMPSVAFADPRRTAAETSSHARTASIAKRRASRSGLGGFKDFIRNLGKDKAHDASTPSRSQSMAHLALNSNTLTGVTRSRLEAVIAEPQPRAAVDPPKAEDDTPRDSTGLPKSRSRRTGLGLGWPEEPPSAPDTHWSNNTDEVVLALTPENLPVLLQYLRQCESKLREWEIRADKVLDQDTVST